MKAPKRKVLLVENDESECASVCKILKSFEGVCVSALDNGYRAMCYLRGEDEYEDREKHPLPAIMLLDLQLDEPSGLQVLKWVKAQGILRRLPVIGICTPFSQDVVNEAYDQGLNCAIARPIGAADFSGVLKAAADFWLNVNKLPTYEPSRRGRSIVES